MDKRCSAGNCDGRIYSYKTDSRGLCRAHEMSRRPMCAVENCLLHVHSWAADSRGLCLTHHRYMVKFGKPEVTMRERLYALTDQSAGPDGCWPWVGGKGTDGGYGRFNNMSPHRISYEIAHGEIPNGMEIDHSCHVPACVNPKHLRLTTVKQNREHLLGAHKDSKSGIRGAHFDRGKWRAVVVHNRKHIHLGRFDTPEEAGEVARKKRLELFTHNDVDRLVG